MKDPVKNKIGTKEPYTANGSEPDCFGNEWVINNSTCLTCGAYDVCAAEMSKTNKKKVKAKKAETKQVFIDDWDFSNVPLDSLKKKMKIEPEKWSFEKVLKVFKKFSDCDDQRTLEIKVSNFLKEETWLSSFLPTK